MQITVSRADLMRVMTAIKRVVEKRSTLPILNTVRLVADGGLLTITGTDLDIVATDTIKAITHDTDGAVCVDAALLETIAKKAGAGDIAIALDGDKLVLKSGRSRFALATLPIDDFPDLNNGTYTAEFEIDLAELFAPVAHAVSNEETRYYLNGVYFAGLTGWCVAVATDGHRLSRNIGPDIGEFPGVIVPKKIVGMLPKCVVNVAVSDSKIRVTSGDLVITSKLIDGTFPDYERVIPQDNKIKFSADREDILRAADRVVTVSSERGRGVKLTVGRDAVGFSARSEVGDAEDEVAISYEGELPADASIGFNSAYLRDLLSAVPAGAVVFELEPGGPGLFTAASLPGWTGVLMPLRVY